MVFTRKHGDFHGRTVSFREGKFETSMDYSGDLVIGARDYMGPPNEGIIYLVCTRYILPIG